MIAEQREKEERTSKDGGVYDVDQKLQSYLRDKFSTESLQSSGAPETLLFEVAKDWCIKHGHAISDGVLHDKVSEAIATYQKNWEGKQPGEDDRGHQFGVTHL